MVASVWGNRALIAQLTRREVISRYRGSVMGLAWSFFNPLLMLAVYTFVFSVVFKARWAGEGASQADFAVFLFVGILIHGIFAECANRAPSLILSNVGYVKKVVFPLEVLPCVAMGSALFHAAVSLLVLLGALLVLEGAVPVTAWLFPVVVAPLVVMTVGAAWLLAAFGVFVRDVGQMIGVVVTVMLFMSPVFYPIKAMPEAYRFWIYANPLTFIIEQARKVLILSEWPDWSGLLAYTAASAAFAWFGYACFQKMRRGFSDVL